jgi:hypothetical protein
LGDWAGWKSSSIFYACLVGFTLLFEWDRIAPAIKKKGKRGSFNAAAKVKGAKNRSLTVYPDVYTCIYHFE